MEENIQTPEVEETAILDALEKVRAMLRYAKDREEAIVSLGKSIEQYRGDFVLTAFKPFALALIDYRENVKKDLSSLEKYPLDGEKIARNIGYLLEELDQLLSDNGIDVEDDRLLYYGHDVSIPLEMEEEKKCEDACPIEAPPPVEEKEEEAYSSEEVKEEKTVCEDACPIEVPKEEAVEPLSEEKEPSIKEKILSLCEEIESSIKEKSLIEGAYKELVELSKARDAENRWIFIYPSLRVISRMREHVAHIGRVISKDEEEAKKDYGALLAYIVEEVASSLEKMGGRIVVTDDLLNTAEHRLVKPVLTDDASLDRRIANKLSDCYALGEKIIYLQKVEVYKSK